MKQCVKQLYVGQSNQLLSSLLFLFYLFFFQIGDLKFDRHTRTFSHISHVYIIRNKQWKWFKQSMAHAYFSVFGETIRKALVNSTRRPHRRSVKCPLLLYMPTESSLWGFMSHL